MNRDDQRLGPAVLIFLLGLVWPSGRGEAENPAPE